MICDGFYAVNGGAGAASGRASGGVRGSRYGTCAVNGTRFARTQPR
jgi:hypothetical protein